MMVDKKKKPWIHEMWSASPFNFAQEALASLPKKVEIHDTTLRDGISDPARAISLTTPQKVKIAQVLDDLGVGRIEIGLTTENALPELKAITDAGVKAKTFAMTPTASFLEREWKAVDIALKANLSGIVCNFPASKYLVEKFLPGWSMEKVLDKSVSMSTYAKERGLFVNFFAYDTTRSDLEYLERLLKAAIEEAKVDTVSIVDTLGVGSPAGIAYMVKLVKKWVDVPIELHPHDDCGLAYANALAGVGAGAQVLHTTVDGIGKMPATQDIVVSLRVLYGLEFKIKYNKIFQTCKFVRETGNWSIDPFRPMSGELAFGYDSDVRIDESRSQRAPFLPEFIGHQYQILLNDKTGPEGIRWRLKELNREASDEEVNRILSEVKTMWKNRRQALSNEEFESIVKEVLS